MFRIVFILSALSLSSKSLASDEVASGFHLGIGAGAGVVSFTNSKNLIASTGELELGFQAENGFLVNGIFHSGFWGEGYKAGGINSRTWTTTGGGAQVGWKIQRLKILAGYQWATIEREDTIEHEYRTINDGHYYGPNAGLSIALVDRPGVGLDIGTRVAFLRWDEQANQERGQNLAVVTSGIHLHLYPAHWEDRGSNVNSHLWLHMPYEVTRTLLELGPRLTLEILRAAASVR